MYSNFNTSYTYLQLPTVVTTNDNDNYDLSLHFFLRYFYMSNIHPIWSGCYGQEDSRAHTIEKVINYLKKNNIINYDG